MNPIVNMLQEHNVRVCVEDGPRLSTKYLTWIDGRDRARRRVLVGGLGCMGCGRMWFDEEPYHADYPGYAEAPEVSET